MPKYLNRIVFFLIALILLRATLLGLVDWQRIISPSRDNGFLGEDFFGYYTAACLVRGNQNPAIYEEALRGVDPVEQTADPNSVFARTARAHGISPVNLYDYPPTLADLLVPLTFFSSSAARFVWLVINLIALFSAGFILLRLLGIKSAGGALLVLVFLVFFRSSSMGLYFGQISNVLLLLMIAGISLYLREKCNSAAALFALAAAIKLVPLILIIPLLAWRDWKTLRAFALSVAAIGAALLVINGGGALSLYFLHDLSKMSSGSIQLDGRSLEVTVEALLHAASKSTQMPDLMWAGRLVCAIVVCLVGWQCRVKCEDELNNSSRIETLAIFMLLACCLSPIAWLYFYLLSAPEMVILAKRTWEDKSSALEAILLLFFTLSISTARFEFVTLMAPVLGSALALVRLRALRLERRVERVSRQPALSLP